VGSDQLAAGEDMALHRVLELLSARLGLQVELRVEREKLVEVAVGSVAGRWAGTPVAALAEAIGALARSMCTLLEAAPARIDVPADPVGEVSGRGVGVVEDEGERLGFLREGAPGERRRGVVALAGVLPGNLLPLIEGSAG